MMSQHFKLLQPDALRLAQEQLEVPHKQYAYVRGTMICHDRDGRMVGSAEVMGFLGEDWRIPIPEDWCAENPVLGRFVRITVELLPRDAIRE